MSAIAFHLAERAVTWGGVLAAAAVIQWLVFVAISIFAPPVKPKKGPRPPDIRFALSSAVLGILSFVAFDGMSLVRFKSTTTATTAAVTPAASHASCAAVKPDLTAAQLESVLGKPDEIRPNDDVRGPGATLWIYRDARCAVAVFDDRVELTE